MKDFSLTKNLKTSKAKDKLVELISMLPTIVYAKILKYLEFPSLFFLLDNCENSPLFKKTILETMKINGIIPEMNKQLTTKIGFNKKLISLTTFNLEFTFVDLLDKDFLDLFTYFLGKKFDYIQYKFNSNSYFHMLRINRKINIPVVIHLSWVCEDGESSFWLAKSMNSIDQFKHYDCNKFYSSYIQSEVINSVNGTPRKSSRDRAGLLNGYIGLTTTPEYFSIVDDFVTQFRAVFTGMYQDKQEELNRIISCKLIREQFELQSAEFWTKLSTVYALDFEPRTAVRRPAINSFNMGCRALVKERLKYHMSLLSPVQVNKTST